MFMRFGAVEMNLVHNHERLLRADSATALFISSAGY